MYPGESAWIEATGRRAGVRRLRITLLHDSLARFAELALALERVPEVVRGVCMFRGCSEAARRIGWQNEAIRDWIPAYADAKFGGWCLWRGERDLVALRGARGAQPPSLDADARRPNLHGHMQVRNRQARNSKPALSRAARFPMAGGRPAASEKRREGRPIPLRTLPTSGVP